MSSAQFGGIVRKVVTVTTAGTSVQISASPLLVRSVIIQGFYNNTGNVYVGDTAANAHAANGHALSPQTTFGTSGDMLNARQIQFDLSNFWVDADTSGGKAIVTYMLAELHQ